MPYNQNLAERIRTTLEAHHGLVEKKMFGGVGFLLHGNMVCGVQGDDLIVRVGIENNDTALSRPFVRSFHGAGGKTNGRLGIGVSQRVRDRSRPSAMG